MYRLLLTLALVCPGWTLGAATLQQLSLDQMTQSATAIVRARVTGSSASFTGNSIYTHYQLRITETWKGFPAAEVMLPGGIASRVENGTEKRYRQSFPGVPTLQTGSEYVLFLWTSSSTGITHLVGLSQGLFNVTAQADGTALVSRPAGADTMLDAHLQPVADRAVSMNLATMKSRVGQARATSGSIQ